MGWIKADGGNFVRETTRRLEALECDVAELKTKELQREIAEIQELFVAPPPEEVIGAAVSFEGASAGKIALLAAPGPLDAAIFNRWLKCNAHISRLLVFILRRERLAKSDQDSAQDEQ